MVTHIFLLLLRRGGADAFFEDAFFADEEIARMMRSHKYRRMPSASPANDGDDRSTRHVLQLSEVLLKMIIDDQDYDAVGVDDTPSEIPHRHAMAGVIDITTVMRLS